MREIERIGARIGPLGWAAVVAFGLSVVVGLRWVQGGRDWTHFALAEERFISRDRTPFPVRIVPGAGYDGQFFLRFAVDPWSFEEEAAGVRLDDPAYRHQRILYPTLAWLVSFGVTGWAPLALVLVNVLTLSATVLVWGALARELGRTPAWGLAALAVPGLLMATGRDTAEPVAVFFLSLAALALVRRRAGLATGALSLAALAREDALLAAIPLLLVARIDRPAETARLRVPAWVVALPVAVFAAWQGALWWGWGEPGVAGAGGRLGLPGAGFVRSVGFLARQPWTESAVQLLYLAWHLLLGVEVVRTLRRPGHGECTPEARLLARWMLALWSLWLLVIPLLTLRTWGDDWAFSRVLAQWSAAGLISLLVRGRAPGWAFMALSGLVFVGTAVRLVLRP